MMAMPTAAHADSAICHNGVLSDDAGQGCADGLYAAAHGSSTHRSSTPRRSSGICSDGILSNDAGQGCPDGMYARVYGSGHSVTTSSYGTRRSWGSSGSGRTYSSSSGGSSNSMVNPNCESGGNSQVVSSNGRYWGKYQFDYNTWVAHGGSPGSYGNAGAGEQDRVASRVTYDAWPNC
jgi:hypothetical protein